MPPLTRSILLALASCDMHRYGIWRQINADQPLEFTSKQRTMYREIDNLSKRGKIKIIVGTTPMRYSLTPFGRRLLKAESSSHNRVTQLFLERLN